VKKFSIKATKTMVMILLSMVTMGGVQSDKSVHGLGGFSSNNGNACDEVNIVFEILVYNFYQYN
jgi:hypothetical protein